MVELHNTLDQPLPEYLDSIPPFLEYILENHKQQDKGLNVVVCDNIYIAGLNQTYRHKEGPTDVLSFPAWEGEDEDIQEENDCLGDVIISLEKAREQAESYEVSEQEEMARLAIHGCLHILGYDHETSVEDEKEMFSLQDDYLDRYLDSLK